MSELPNPGAANVSIPSGDDNSGARTTSYTDASFNRGIRVDINSKDSVTARTQRSWNEFDAAPKRDGEILSTARTATGGPAKDLSDDTVVTVRGVGMKISSAIEHGYLAVNENGALYEVDPEWIAQQEQKKADAKRAEEIAGRVLPDTDTMAAVDSLRDALEAHGLDAAQGLAELWTAKDGALPKTFEHLARATNTPDHVMHAQLSSLVQAWSEAVDDQLIRPSGVDPTTFWDWAEKTFTRAEHARASMHLALRGNAVGYKAMLDRYVAAHGAGPGGRSGTWYNLPQGWTAHKNTKGEQLVTGPVEGGRVMTMRFQTARSMGYV